MTYPHTATIKRTVKSGTKYTFADYGSSQCFLQPLDDQDAQIVGITMSKGSYCYVPYVTDVLMGDRLIVSGVTYGVKGVKSHNYGNLTHKRLLLEEL